MTIKATTLAALALAGFTAGIAAQPAMAQDDGAPEIASNGTSFRGIRVEGNFGGDRFQSEGNHNDKFGYGGTIGFDGTLGERFVIGAEGSYWRPGNGNENSTDLGGGTSIDHKAFEEWGAAVRAGYLATPQLLVFAKGGYVNGEQRRRISGPTGATLVYDHYRADGYQVGGGVEYTLTQGSLPVYVNAQYVYSNYHGNSSRQRVMGGVGVRFK
ncbi:MAG: porin family protein [Novosphingobium lindaniclasticum]|jgi:outer membrane immunogenic protein|uniref:Membrane protein n=1 Tax=Novosphingobium lindaniclasticum LE124 TaxID=1096930 RepID=T0HTI1_9SPHN|nr:porin family protein [Novosphingobium lindaniclasticum]EQB19686.1 membrane protein [Novosphingobium lindaniclasticum LE124]MDF2638154.1 porin family protein [Novosphingobium lindaniclasticum]